MLNNVKMWKIFCTEIVVVVVGIVIGFVVVVVVVVVFVVAVVVVVVLVAEIPLTADRPESLASMSALFWLLAPSNWMELRCRRFVPSVCLSVCYLLAMKINRGWDQRGLKRGSRETMNIHLSTA